ncbi:MAG: hypothetical protein ABI411_20255, partial [Tahibacter sp.]
RIVRGGWLVRQDAERQRSAKWCDRGVASGLRGLVHRGIWGTVEFEAPSNNGPNGFEEGNAVNSISCAG